MTQVALIAPKYLNNNRIFNIYLGRDGGLERFSLLRETLKQHGTQCDTFDVCGGAPIDILICLDIASSLKQVQEVIRSNPTVKIIYIACGEPPVISCLHENHILAVMPFDRIAFWDDDFVQQCERGIKCNMGQPIIDHEKIPVNSFQKKKFMVAITSSKLVKHKNCTHQERFHAFEFFSQKPESMDLYGFGWDKTSYAFVKTSYRGVCETKKGVLQDYKFAICFENSQFKGYISEKIFDCFAAGTVPIYYGALNVTDYIPENCFIDFNRFSNYDDLYQFMINMTEDEYQYYKDSVKEFLKTPEYYEFTSKRYAEIVLGQVQSLMNEPSHNRTLLSFKWILLKIVLRHPFFFVKNIKQCRRFLFDLLFAF